MKRSPDEILTDEEVIRAGVIVINSGRAVVKLKWLNGTPFAFYLKTLHRSVTPTDMAEVSELLSLDRRFMAPGEAGWADDPGDPSVMTARFTSEHAIKAAAT